MCSYVGLERTLFTSLQLMDVIIMDIFSVAPLMDVNVILIYVTFSIYVICWASIYEYTCFNYPKLLFSEQKEISDYLTTGS